MVLFTLWVWLGFLGDPAAFAIALLASSAAVVWVIIEARKFLGIARLAVFLGGVLAIPGIACIGFLSGVAWFPLHVRHSLPEFEVIAIEARQLLDRSKTTEVTVPNPRWDLDSARARRQASGEVEVWLSFRGKGRLTIVKGVPEHNVAGEGSCLVEFAPRWFWYRPCTEGKR